MKNQIKVKVFGHPETTLTFYPKRSIGGIHDGVAFENGNTGGWVIAYSDFLEMVKLAQQHHAQQSVNMDGARVCPECGEAVEFCAMGHYVPANPPRQ